MKKNDAKEESHVDERTINAVSENNMTKDVYVSLLLRLRRPPPLYPNLLREVSYHLVYE
jgi:hypothetical protein